MFAMTLSVRGRHGTVCKLYMLEGATLPHRVPPFNRGLQRTTLTRENPLIRACCALGHIISGEVESISNVFLLLVYNSGHILLITEYGVSNNVLVFINDGIKW